MTARARKRRKRITLPGGQTAMPPTPQRQGQRNDMEYRRSDAETALAVRARRSGHPDTPEGRKAVSGPEFGCAVGRKIMADTIDPGDKADLWQAVCHMRRVWLAYNRAIGAPNRHAKCLSILAPTDAMSADAASPAPDLRPQAERDVQAVSAYMATRGWLGYVEGRAQSAAIRAVVDEPEEDFSQWGDIKRALLCVVDGIKGRRIAARFATTP